MKLVVVLVVDVVDQEEAIEVVAVVDQEDGDEGDESVKNEPRIKTRRAARKTRCSQLGCTTTIERVKSIFSLAIVVYFTLPASTIAEKLYIASLLGCHLRSVHLSDLR
jgi:hypothetical protein